ncbi:MAG TPA: hypothetical protein VHZ52_01725 [Acidobacteriaceae bacterium]|jgi:hypothetical protein|nr:hypothetical protein [Acidobacteriaceae bacterium]
MGTVIVSEAKDLLLPLPLHLLFAVIPEGNLLSSLLLLLPLTLALT